MIRVRLRRLAAEAMRRIEEERDASQVRIYSAPWVVDGDGMPIADGAIAFDAQGRVLATGEASDVVGTFPWAGWAELDGILMPGLVNAHARFETGESDAAGIRSAVHDCVESGTAAAGEVTDSLRAVHTMAQEGLYGVVFHKVRELAAAAAQKAGVVPWPDGILYRLAPYLVDAAPPVRQEHGDGAAVVLCPRAQLHDTGRLPPLVSFLEEGCCLALGTDSPSTSADGSVLREAAELHAAYPEIPAMVLIRAATSGGADALGLASLGSFAPGAAPGLVRVDTLGSVPEDPCGWILRAGQPEISWLVRPAPPTA